MTPVRSICGLSYIALKLQVSGPFSARAAALPKAALAAPRGRGRPPMSPTSAPKRPHGDLMSTLGLVKIVVYCRTLFYDHIMAC